MEAACINLFLSKSGGKITDDVSVFSEDSVPFFKLLICFHARSGIARKLTIQFDFVSEWI